MKIKKALAGILAVAMIITLMPSMAFATTTGTVSSCPTVSSDTVMPEVSIDLEVKDSAGWAANTTNQIKLTFTNAEWTANPTTGAGAQSTIRNMLFVSDNHKVSGSVTSSTTIDSVVSVGDNYVELVLKSVLPLDKNDVITLDFYAGVLKSLDEVGSVKIAIDGLDSKISSTELTVANVGTSNTVATVTGTVRTIARGTQKLDGIVELRETAVNTITSDQLLKLTLPKGCTWSDLAVDGNLFKAVTNLPTLKDAGSLANLKALAGTTGSNGAYFKDDRNLYIILEYDYQSNGGTPPVDKNLSVRNVATFTSTINVGKTASVGDITVGISSIWTGYTTGTQVKGNSVSDASDLVVAKYGEEAVTITTAAEADLPTIYTGTELTTKDKYNWVQVTLEESVKGSLSAGRNIDVVLPEGVQFVQDGTAVIRTTLKKNPKIADASSYYPIDPNLIEWEEVSSSTTDAQSNVTPYAKRDKDMSQFTLTVPAVGDYVDDGTNCQWVGTKGNIWSIFIPVTVRADYTGDITMTLTGAKAGISDTELVVAKAVAPITVEAASTDVKNGVQKQATANITITENLAGVIRDDKKVIIKLDDLGLTGGLAFDENSVKATVTSGDLDISKTRVITGSTTTTTVSGTTTTITSSASNVGAIELTIKAASTKASTIEISGLSASLSRTMPEGPYNVNVYGSALIDNGDYVDKKFSADKGVYAAKVANYINIVTPAESTTVTEKVDAQFVIGATSYTKNGETVTMDAASYIDENNRTMVPVRYVANACGISENDVTWNQATQTVTINGLNTVVTVKMGSTTINTSNGAIVMDTVAVNKDGRIYVPARYIANALGANVSWDATTKTVTLTK